MPFFRDILIFMTDNGSVVGSSVYNAGMRGGKRLTNAYYVYVTRI